MQKLVIDTDGVHLVTPEIAQELIATLKTDVNRPIVLKNIEAYKADMLSGNWHNNYDPIRVSETLELLDGQHRLHAIAESEVAIEMYFIFGIPDSPAEGIEMFELIDMKFRKNYEVLSIKYPHLKHSKAVAKLIDNLEAFKFQRLIDRPSQFKTTNRTILATAEYHRPLETLDNMAERGQTLYSRGENNLLSVDEAILLSATIDTCNKGNQFLEDFFSYSIDDGIIYDNMGHEVLPTDPVANVVKVLNKIKTLKVSGTFTAKVKWLQIFKAYEIFLAGDEVNEGYRYTGKQLPYPVDFHGYYEYEPEDR